MTTNPQVPTTSHELADKLYALLQDQGDFQHLEVMHPTDGLRSLGAHSALVLITQDGSRFGMEITPFPTPKFYSAAAILNEAPQGPDTVRGVDGATEGA